MLIVNAALLVVLYAMQRLQHFLPFNPNGFGSRFPHSSWNTAVSSRRRRTGRGTRVSRPCCTSPRWPGCPPQLPVGRHGNRHRHRHHPRDRREKPKGIGNFWDDCTRPILWCAALLLPGRAVFVSVASSRTSPARYGQRRSRARAEDRTAPSPPRKRSRSWGPTAAGSSTRTLASVRELHAWNEIFQVVLIFAIGAGLTRCSPNDGIDRHGWVVRGHGLPVPGRCRRLRRREQRGNPIDEKPASRRADGGGTGGNMEGKEVRFGIGDLTLFATVTTDALRRRLFWHDRTTDRWLVCSPTSRRERSSWAAWRRPLRDVLFIVSRFHCGAHGRPHARVPCQEDRGARGKSRCSGPRPYAVDPGFSAAAAVLLVGLSRSPTRGRTGPPRSLCLRVGGGQQRIRLSGLFVNTLFYRHRPGLRHVLRPLLHAHPDFGIAGRCGEKKVPEFVGTFP